MLVWWTLWHRGLCWAADWGLDWHLEDVTGSAVAPRCFKHTTALNPHLKTYHAKQTATNLPTARIHVWSISSPWPYTPPSPTWTTHMKMLFINFSLAFNTIIPSKLTTKCDDLGIPNNCNWILDFQTKRPQYVGLDDHTSSNFNLKIGVPQGRVLRDVG